MNKGLYFQHDYDARNDVRILELRAEFGAEGYGIYWMIIETMFKDMGIINRGAIGGLSLGYGVAKDTLMPIIDYCLEIGLFYSDDENSMLIYSERVNKQLEFRKQLSIKGLEGAKKRWSKPKNGGAIGGANAKGKERKEKNKELLSDFETFWNLYEKKIGQKKCKARFLNLTKAQIEKILGTVEMFVESTPDPQFRPHPLTYLHGELWENEIIENKSPLQVREDLEKKEIQRKFKLGLI